MDTSSDKPKKLKREYDENFVVTPEYRKSLPDIQNSGSEGMEGAHVPILQVGISGFRLPMQFVGPDGESLNIETKITGTVSLDADKKGSTCPVSFVFFTNIKMRFFLLKSLAKFFAITRIDWIHRKPVSRLTFHTP